ncbi:YdeI family protein [Streptosporangium lutulentum]
MTPEQEHRFRAETTAWTWFQGQPPGYRRTALHWVTAAKRPETREKRLTQLIEDSAQGRRLS